MSDPTEDFEMVWQRMEYATEEHAKILVVNADLRKRIAELERDNERLKGNIPAYEPPPCECCRKFTDYYAAECDCGNLGDHEAAVRWCVRTDIADSFAKVLGEVK